MNRAARVLPLVSVLILFPLLQSCNNLASPSNSTNSPGSSSPGSSSPTVVTVSIPESSVELAAGEGHQFTATVTGTTENALVWSIATCSGACGSISSTGLYTAPSQIPITMDFQIRATSKAYPANYDSADVHLIPVAVKIDPAATRLSPGQSEKFTATVDPDIDHMGVTWSLSCSDTFCGTLTDATLTSVVYTAPSALSGSPVVLLKANSAKHPTISNGAAVSVTVVSNETLAEGDYAFLFDGWKTSCPPTGCDAVRAALAGQFHADGKGQITSGVEDLNIESGSFQTLPITGSYELQSDHRGTLILKSSEGTAKYRMSVNASGHGGTFIAFEAGRVNGLIFGTGSFEKQDGSAFSMQALRGPYAVGLFGEHYGIWGAENQSAIGRFDVSTTGVVNSGRMDLQRGSGSKTVFDIGSYRAVSYNLGGTLSPPSIDTGRGSATLNFVSAESGETGTLNFAYYVVSADRILLVGTDSPVPEISNAAPILSGEARRQAGPFSSASLAGPSIFSMTATATDLLCTTQDAVVGQLVADGRGSLSGVLDSTGNEVVDEGPPLSNQAFTASYAVDPDGRTVFNKIPAEKSDSQIAYLFEQNQGFLMDATAGFARFGRIEPQDEGPFDNNSISGPLVLAVSRSTGYDTDFVSGWIQFAPGGGASILADSNDWGVVNNEISWLTPTSYAAGNYSVASNGRGALKLNSPSTNSDVLVFWVASPSRIVALGRFAYWWPVLMEFRQ